MARVAGVFAKQMSSRQSDKVKPFVLHTGFSYHFFPFAATRSKCSFILTFTILLIKPYGIG